MRSAAPPPPVRGDRARRERALGELVSSALHTVGRYASNPAGADHGRLKARLWPMRGLKRHRSARILAAGHAFVPNLRRGHCGIATASPAAACSAPHSTIPRSSSEQQRYQNDHALTLSDGTTQQCLPGSLPGCSETGRRNGAGGSVVTGTAYEAPYRGDPRTCSAACRPRASQRGIPSLPMPRA